LQYLNLPFDLFLLDGFEDFDDTFLVVDDVYALKDFRVLATTNLPHNFVVVCVPTRSTLAAANKGGPGCTPMQPADYHNPSTI